MPGQRLPKVKRDWRAGAAMTPEKEKALKNMNAMRQRQGRAPLTAEAYSQGVDQGPGSMPALDAGVDPGSGGGISPMIMAAGAAVIGLLWFMKKRRGTP